MATTVRPYPSSIPSDVWGIVADAFAGNWPDRNHAIHCAEDVAAFVLGKMFPDGQAPLGKQALPDATKAECEAYCRAMSTSGVKALSFNWLSLLLQVLTLIMDNVKQA